MDDRRNPCPPQHIVHVGMPRQPDKRAKLVSFDVFASLSDNQCYLLFVSLNNSGAL